MTRYSFSVLVLFLTVALATVKPAYAQPPTADPKAAASDPEPAASPAQPADDDDAKLRPAEPDFVTINLPTTLPLPKHAMNFHLTHRFNEDLRGDSFETSSAISSASTTAPTSDWNSATV